MAMLPRTGVLRLNVATHSSMKSVRFNDEIISHKTTENNRDKSYLVYSLLRPTRLFL